MVNIATASLQLCARNRAARGRCLPLTQRGYRRRLVACALVMALPGCTGNSSVSESGAGGSGPLASGGTGPLSATGGASSSSTGNERTGGAASSGGASTSSTGAFPTGGVQAVGGAATSTGGNSPGLGGMPGSGGSRTNAGGFATGGQLLTTGGRANTGGRSSAAGGSVSSGGTPGSGGTATGGVTSSTVTTSNSACVESSCGSHKWPCWKMPNPASSNLPNAASYTDLGNGAVRDNVTCLVWEKSPGGTAVDGATNLAHCESLASSNFAGFGDWRVPTRVEMASIVDYTKNPGYPSALTTPKAYYRTISNWYETITGQSSSGFAWIYGQDGFTSNAYAWSSTATVRCVRGNGQGEGQNEFAKEPPNHYTIDTAAGETTDNYTALIWQQGSSPSTMAWSEAANYCATLNLNGHTWRVPSLNELASIVNEALVAPAVNRTAFPNTKYGSKSNNWYWANAQYAGSNYGWAINYDDGFTGYNSGASGSWNYFTAAYVKCVR